MEVITIFKSNSALRVGDGAVAVEVDNKKAEKQVSITTKKLSSQLSL